MIEFEPRLLLRIGRSTAAVSFLFLIYLPTALGEVSTVIGGVRPFVFFYFFNQLIFDLNFLHMYAARRKLKVEVSSHGRCWG